MSKRFKALQGISVGFRKVFGNFRGSQFNLMEISYRIKRRFNAFPGVSMRFRAFHAVSGGLKVLRKPADAFNGGFVVVSDTFQSVSMRFTAFQEVSEECKGV